MAEIKTCTKNLLRKFSWFLNSATGEFAIFSLQDYDPDFKNSEEFLAAISNAVLE